MIKFFLNEILEELNISQTGFAKQADIRPNTINDICNNRTKRIEISTLNQIMKVLNELNEDSYNINDLISYSNEIEKIYKRTKE